MASAGGPPVLTCPQIQPDPNAAGNTGGTTFDDGSGPGSAGMYLSANAGGSGVLAATAYQGATSIKLTTLAISGETLTVANAAGTYTVTNESNALGQPVSLGYPATVAITPNLDITTPPVHGIQLLKAKITAVTVNPTVTTPNRSVNDGVVSGTDLQSATANFTGADVGQPVTGSNGGSSIFPSGGPPVTIQAVNSTTDVTLSSAATYSGGGVVLTIGQDQYAPAMLTGDFDFQATQCQAIPYALFQGVYTPTSATLQGQNAGIANSAISLEYPPSQLSVNVTYPAIGAGWCDYGGAPGCDTQPTTSITWAIAKDRKFVLLQNSYLYLGGAATGDYHTLKSTMGLAANGMVTCTVGQLQAIASGTGPDAGSVPQGSSALLYCDGGPDSPVSASAALTNLITLELNPQANVYGSDGTSLAGIWQVGAGPNGNTVI